MAGRDCDRGRVLRLVFELHTVPSKQQRRRGFLFMYTVGFVIFRDVGETKKNHNFFRVFVFFVMHAEKKGRYSYDGQRRAAGPHLQHTHDATISSAVLPQSFPFMTTILRGSRDESCALRWHAEEKPSPSWCSSLKYDSHPMSIVHVRMWRRQPHEGILQTESAPFLY